jgi:hypothetical protein
MKKVRAQRHFVFWAFVFAISGGIVLSERF